MGKNIVQQRGNGTCCAVSGSYTSFVVFTEGVYKGLDKSESISESVMGYGEGGTQVGEAWERLSSSFSAVGLAALDLLQHNFTSSQSSSEKPRDLAVGGFSGCPPVATVCINSQWDRS